MTALKYRPDWIILLSLLLAAGCASSPEQAPTPDIQEPPEWTAGPIGVEGTPEAWLQDFEDPILTALVQEALVNNADLKSTAAKFDQSIAEARIAGADRRPSAGLGLNGTRQKISTFGPTSTGGVRFENYNLSLDVSWELDLWGRLFDRTSAAIAQAEASQAELEAARMSLAAQVARAWFNYKAAAEQLALATRTAETYIENLKTGEARFRKGLSEGINLRRTRTQKASAIADVATRKRTLDRAARALEVLLGRYPAASLESGTGLPELPAAIPTGLPSDLLNRRPDLIAAERRLAAADKELLASKKERLPKISLTASGGSSSQEFKNLLDSNFSVWSLGANLAQPIFQGGRIRAGIDRRAALRDQTLANYRATALRAFLEVESTLAAESFLKHEQTQLYLAASEAAAAEKLAKQGYYNGTSEFIVWLDAQRTADSVNSRLIATRNLLLQNRVDLYLALGGPFLVEP